MPDDEQKTDEKKPAAGPTPEPDEAAPREVRRGSVPPGRHRRARGRIGEETELDRVANEEEQQAPRAQEDAEEEGPRGRGVQAPREDRRGTAVKRPSALGAVSPDADPLLERAARAGSWIKEHRQTFGGFAAVAVLAIAGFGGWSYWQDKRNGRGVRAPRAGPARPARVRERQGRGRR